MLLLSKIKNSFLFIYNILYILCNILQSKTQTVVSPVTVSFERMLSLKMFIRYKQ